MGIQTNETGVEGAVQLEFGLPDPSYPFVGATAATDARLVLEEMVPRSDGTFTEFFAITGEDPRAVLDRIEGEDGPTGRLLSATPESGLVELVVETGCPAVFLADAGAIPHVVASADGEGRIVAEVPDAIDASVVAAEFLAAHPSADLAARRQHEPGASPFREGGLPDALETPLTDRQHEVLEVTHEAGYYEWPRDVTAEEIAADLDISAPTFHQHRRAAERKVVGLLVDADATSETRTDGSVR